MVMLFSLLLLNRNIDSAHICFISVVYFRDINHIIIVVGTSDKCVYLREATSMHVTMAIKNQYATHSIIQRSIIWSCTMHRGR